MLVPRIDELLSTIDLPVLGIAVPALRTEDTLVTCAGFEDRALAFLGRAVQHGSAGFKVIGINYRPMVIENHLDLLDDLGLRASAKMSLITYDREDPGSSDEIFSAAARSKRILVDISGMSRLLIVQLIASAVRSGSIERLTLIYTEAASYPPTREAVDKKLAEGSDYFGILNFISSGVLGITVVPELSTVSMQGQPVRLVAFPSFNPAQFAAVSAEIQASFFSIINGVPLRTENLWRRDAIRTLNSIDSVPEKEEFDTSTFDYRETLNVLLRIYRAYGATQKLVICPTGSKMQSVAVGIVCGFLRDLQIVYPTPRSFPSPTSYTEGALESYQLPLGLFSALAMRAEDYVEAEPA